MWACRNTVFGAEAQEASHFLDGWLAAGIRHYRLAFVHKSGEEVTQIARTFAATLAGEQTAAQLSRKLAGLVPAGVTEGSLFVTPNFLEIPLAVA